MLNFPVKENLCNFKHFPVKTHLYKNLHQLWKAMLTFTKVKFLWQWGKGTAMVKKEIHQFWSKCNKYGWRKKNWKVSASVNLLSMLVKVWKKKKKKPDSKHYSKEFRGDYIFQLAVSGKIGNAIFTKMAFNFHENAPIK